jgi:uncharacterized protein (DUF2336 family)
MSSSPPSDEPKTSKKAEEPPSRLAAGWRRRRWTPTTATTPAAPRPGTRLIQSRLHDLIALADEPSSSRRRELLRGVTDLFFTAENHGDVEMGLFDDVMGQLAGEMEEAVRIELAERLGQAPPRRPP